MLTTRKRKLLGHHEGLGCVLNLAGDYDYLSKGYYLSQEAEADGLRVYPTCKEILDAYVTPLLLEKASLAGIRVAKHYITNDYFEPPVVVDPINPFMSSHAVAHKASQQQRVARSISRNFTYAMCCQELPDGSRISWFRGVLGHCASARYIELACAVWEVFRIPLARVRVISLSDGDAWLSAIYPLAFQGLRTRELALIDAEVQWLT